MATDLWLPNGVTREMEEARREFAASLVSHIRTKMNSYNKELRKLDPHVQVVWAEPRAQHPLLRPGYWHIIRDNGAIPPTVKVIEGPNGEFREPDSGIFRELQEGDLWNERVLKDRRKRQVQAEKARQRMEERERQERVDDMTERLRSLKGTQILVPRKV